MKALLTLIALAAVLALVLAFTKPTQADFEAALEERLLAQIDAAEITAGDAPGRAILLATCKLGRTQCAEVLRALMEVEYTDNTLFSQATITLGEGDTARCLGVFDRIFCERD